MMGEFEGSYKESKEPGEMMQTYYPIWHQGEMKNQSL
jgi:hypothetical protein